MERIAITKQGYSNLQQEIKNLKSVSRPAVIEAIGKARALGDLSENAEYHAAKEKQGFIETRIATLEDRVARAHVIDVSKLSGSTITFGATVTIVDEDTERSVKYQIVGADEAHVEKGKLSIDAPIARALIGKKVGDSVEVHTPRGNKYYEIEKIIYC